MTRQSKNIISFVIPIYNEAESLNELHQQILKVVNSNKSLANYEIIFINDGSTDTSLASLKNICSKNHKVKIISFRKNQGKATALDLGFKKATGKIIATLDGDLQDDPKNIPAMIKLLNNFDLVVGWKKKRHDPLSKTIPSKLFNRLVRGFSKLPLHDFNSGLKVMKNEVAQEIKLYGEMHRFIPVLAARKGFKITELAVTHHARKYGQSKYGWRRLFKGFFDFLTIVFIGALGESPLYFFGIIGSLSILLGLVFGVYLSVLHFNGISIGNRPLLILAMLLIIAGLQILLSGLIAELIVHRTNEHKDVPIDFEN